MYNRDVYQPGTPCHCLPHKRRRSVLAAILVASLSLLLGGARCAWSQSLHAFITASSEVVSPGEHFVYELTVTNTGASPLTGVSAAVLLPAKITGFNPAGSELYCAGTCSPGETASWTIGTLAAGQSRTTYYGVVVAADASGTMASSITASASGTPNAEASLESTIEPSAVVHLCVAPDPGPAVAGQPFTYTLTYGNIGPASLSGVILRAPIPEGATFTSASGGGSESGGTVSWSLGTLAPPARAAKCA
jgi:uncharacterized repeat protein (TIGR01451 family)